MSRQHISVGLRQRVAEVARYRCGYCLTSQKVIGPLLEIDHIVPEAKGGTNAEENLFLACPMCNSYKGARTEASDPDTGQVVSLFNPRTQRWTEHFDWSEDGTVIQGKTPVGRGTTVATLNMNHPDIVAARRMWVIVGWHPPKD